MKQPSHLYRTGFLSGVLILLLSVFQQGCSERTPQSGIEVILELHGEAWDRADGQQKNEIAVRTQKLLITRLHYAGYYAEPVSPLTANSDKFGIRVGGIGNPDSVLPLLRTSESISFWETFGYNEGWKVLEDVNNWSKRKIQPQGDSGSVAIEEDTVSDSMALEEFKAKNPFAGLIQGLRQSPEQSPLMGFVYARDTARVMGYIREARAEGWIREKISFYFEARPIATGEPLFGLIAIRIPSSGKPILNGDCITDAYQEYSSYDPGQIIISMKMNPEGAKQWERMTAQNIGKYIAIIMDNKVLSYPVVNSKISGGNSAIFGAFSVQEARDLAAIIKGGALPASVKVIGSTPYGPGK